MPNNAIAKTKSALRESWRLALVIVFTVFTIWAMVVLPRLASKPVRAGLHGHDYTLYVGGSSAPEQQNGATYVAGGYSYTLNSAQTTRAQLKGLSGLPHLVSDSGMLFIYPNMDQRCFWMKGMEFPLDIIWANTQKQVTHIEQNVSPRTFPQSFCAPAQYVIELNAGEIRRSGVWQLQVLDF